MRKETRKARAPARRAPRRERAFEGPQRCRFDGVLYHREDVRVEHGYRELFEARIGRWEACSDS